MRTEGPIHPIRMRKHLKPQEHWGWIIAIYLYLAGMGAGSYIIGTLINWFVGPSKIGSLFGLPVDAAKAALLWGPVLVAIGAPFLILDLGIKKRFLYACLNPKTSWVARGFLILSIFIVFGIVDLATSVLPFPWLHPASPLWHVVRVIAFCFAFATAIYTGILLKATKSVPLWNTYLLPLLFLVSALSTGSMAIILSSLGASLFPHAAGVLKTLVGGEQILVGVEGIVLYLYLSGRYRSAEQGKDSVRLLLFGEKRFIFWGGIVALGLVFPIILENIASLFPDHRALIFVSGLILLCGGFFLRLGVVSAGIRDQIPMHRLIEFQYQLKTPNSKF
jgi:formate-dependent nitrite reductase membrane component NrfD